MSRPLRSRSGEMLLLAVALLSPLNTSVLAAQQSCSCVANRQGLYSNSPKFIMATEEANNLLGSEFADAKSEWNGALAASGSSIRLGWNTPDNAIRVYFDDSICGYAWADTRPQYLSMQVCRDLLNHPEFLKRVVRHELGHVLGLAKNDNCSKGESVMTEIGPEDMSGAATSIGCADWNAIHEHFRRRDEDNDNYSPDDDPNSGSWEPECADHNPAATTCDEQGGSEETTGVDSEQRYLEGGTCTIEWTVTYVRYWDTSSGSWGPWGEVNRTVNATDCPPWYY